jgi:hypothetical protein
MEQFESHFKTMDKDQALCELTQLKAMKVLITNNVLGCEIHIAGMVMGVCDNSKILPILEFQEREIKKFLKGKSNMWI